MKRLSFLFAVLLLASTASRPSHAADLDQAGWLWPITDPAKMTLGEGEALVVIGYSLRGVEINGFGVPFPVHAAWMPFGQMGQRVGKAMLVTVERCAHAVSQACESVQYRAFRVPAGDYSLAWVFRDRLFSFVKFEHGDVRFNRNTREIYAAISRIRRPCSSGCQASG